MIWEKKITWQEEHYPGTNFQKWEGVELYIKSSILFAACYFQQCPPPKTLSGDTFWSVKGETNPMFEIIVMVGLKRNALRRKLLSLVMTRGCYDLKVWRGDNSTQKPPFWQKPGDLSSSVWNPPSIHFQKLFVYVIRNRLWRLFEYLPSTCHLPNSITRASPCDNHPSPPLLCPRHQVHPPMWIQWLSGYNYDAHNHLGPTTSSCGLMEDADHCLCRSA